jgi:hypothetical protein
MVLLFSEAKRLSWVEPAHYLMLFYIYTVLRFPKPNQNQRKRIEFQNHCTLVSNVNPLIFVTWAGICEST